MKYIKKRKYYSNTLENKAIQNGCLSSDDIRSFLYPNNDLIKLWIRKEKNNDKISQRKVEISAYLVKLECNCLYTMALFTFVNKYTGNIFQLDFKYYGKLWWVFKDLRSYKNVKPRSSRC